MSLIDGRGLGIFANNADNYWNAGLPAMPLKMFNLRSGVFDKDGKEKPDGKQAVIERWQSLQNRMPDMMERDVWKKIYADGNIGIVLGPQSGLVAMDMDSDDPKVQEIIDSLLPPSPWTRIGAKGSIRVYRHQGQAVIRIKHEIEPARNGQAAKHGTLIEMLGAGAQMVVPPSIHPTTCAPYTANTNLWDVLDDVQPLPHKIEDKLRAAFRDAGFVLGSSGLGAITNYTAPGNRDNTLTAMAGLFSRDILHGKKSLKEAFEQIVTHSETFMGKVWGDNVDVSKGPSKIVEFLIRDVTGPRGRPLPKGWDDGISDEEREKWGLTIFNKTDEMLPVKEIMEFFNAQIAKTGVKDNPDQVSSIIRQVLSKLIDNDLVDNLDEDALLRHMAEVSGKKFSMTAIRRMLVNMRQTDMAGESHVEIAEAMLSRMREDGEVIFQHEILWQWRGSAWEPVDNTALQGRIALEYGKYPAGKRSSDHAGIVRVIKNITVGELCKSDIKGINFCNGYLTEDLVLKEHHPDFGMTYTVPYPYLPQSVGKAVRWNQMLLDYWGKDPDYHEKVRALGEAMALTLFNRMPSVQKAVCLFGVAGSGKTRVMQIMQGLMPAEGQVSLPPTEWGDKYGPATLVGKSLNFAGELTQDQLIDSAKFKLIVEGGTISAQHKYGQPFDFRPTCAHWFASNHTPRTRDSSAGFTRRWLFLVFNRVFSKSDEILDYEKLVLSEEREAIAAWAISHITAMRENGWKITEPPSGAVMREHLENELNSVRDFISTMRDQGKIRMGTDAHAGVPDTHNYSLMMTLYDEYRSFAISQGQTPVGTKGFHSRMSHLQGTFGFVEEKISGNGGLPMVAYRFLSPLTAVQSRLRVA